MGERTVSNEFKPIVYRIAIGTGVVTGTLDLEVAGFAFETPGWPEFHACVRFGNRWNDGLFDDWIIDHYETGLAISPAGYFKNKEEAPAALAALLDKVGRERVNQELRRHGVIP